MRDVELGKNFVIVERTGFLKRRKFYSPELVAEKLDVSIYHLQSTLTDHHFYPSIMVNGVGFFSRKDLKILNQLLFRGRMKFIFWGL